MRAAFLVGSAARLLTAGSVAAILLPADARTAQAGVTGAQHSNAIHKCPSDLTAASFAGQWVDQVNGSKRLELIFTNDPSHQVAVDESTSNLAGGGERHFIGNGSYPAHDGGLDNFTATGLFNFQGSSGKQWTYTVSYTFSSPTCEEVDGQLRVTRFRVSSIDVNPATVYTMKRS